MKDKPEVAKADAVLICQMIVDMMNSGNLTDTDPQVMALSNTISQICVCLKDDFKQFLPAIMPPLLKDLNRDIDFKVIDVDEVGGDDEGETNKGI